MFFIKKKSWSPIINIDDFFYQIVFNEIIYYFFKCLQSPYKT